MIVSVGGKKRRIQSLLIIRRVLPGDAGSYQCRAKNRAGESSKRARVAVFQRRVRPPPTPKPTGPDKPKPPDSWRAAEACDIPSYCLNGGSCTLYRSVMEYVCQCAEGFKGKRCERKTVYAIKRPGCHSVKIQRKQKKMAPVRVTTRLLTSLMTFLVVTSLLPSTLSYKDTSICRFSCCTAVPNCDEAERIDCICPGLDEMALTPDSIPASTTDLSISKLSNLTIGGDSFHRLNSLINFTRRSTPASEISI
ncbi:Protein vein [Amphibalanus amphitrite]|uniref:Protein vein n=1 Tax=Amphibalanus amphitrite TaxID=1232801 RepID=A0A6A4WV76_AMPAM|nr:Protein vein [Amphibalanus amphitrite]